MLAVLDIENRPYVRSLLRGMIEVRDEEMERRKSLDVPEDQQVSYAEPTVSVGDAIERSSLSYEVGEEGNEAQWAAAQQYLHENGLIRLEGGQDRDGLYSYMQFRGTKAVGIGKKSLD